MQEAFIKVWLKAAVFDPSRSSPITWLSALARNTAIDRLRARGSRPAEPLSAAAFAVPDPSASACATLEASEQSRLMASCIDQLQDRQAAAIRGAFFGGATYVELASREGVPLSTVKSWVRRGLVHLKCICTAGAAAEEEHGLFVASQERPASILRPLPMRAH
nr:sigma-70 family RNA polymerase sigma factor [uncultured Sphingosinicella sp.]